MESESESDFKLNCYTIALEDDKIYVHPTKYEDSRENMIKILTEAYIASPFVRENKINFLLKTMPISSYSDIDRIVKEHMLAYGIINVRGGSYSELILPDYKLRILEEELSTLKFSTEEKLVIYNKIMKNYDTDKNLSDEDIKLRIALNKAKQKEYEKTLATYNKLRYVIFENEEKIELYNSFLMEFQFLKSHIDTFYTFISQILTDSTVQIYLSQLLNNPATSSKYNYIIRILKKLPALFIEAKKMGFDSVDASEFTDTEILQQFIKVEYIPFVKNPGLEFDRYFNTWYLYIIQDTLSNAKYVENVKSTAYPVLNILEYMFNTIMNKIDECKFDLSSYEIFYESPEVNEFKMNVDYYEFILSCKPMMESRKIIM